MQYLARATPSVAAVLCLGVLGGCVDGSRLPEHADVGPNPVLSKPQTGLVPTVNIAPAEPWPSGAMPLAASGLQVRAFATGLLHPRWLHVLPNGDVLVAETNAPPRAEAGKGFKGWVMKHMMRRAGAGTPSANRITLLRDADGDGRAETRSLFIEGLNSPFGMALVGDRFYVANTDSIWEYPYSAGALSIDGPGRQLTELPGGPLNHHWTKSLIASPDGRMLYATVGSNSNVAENGMTAEEGRAAIWQIDRSTGAKRLYATGLRNPNGMAWVGSGAEATLWTVVNERDELGNDLVPDYLTSVREGAFYGWPYSWFGSHVDERVKPTRADLVTAAVVPDYALGSHVAPLGLAASVGSPIPPLFGRALPPATPEAPAERAASSPTAASAVASASAPAAPAVWPAASAPHAALAPLTAASAAAPAGGAATGPVQGMFVGLHGSWNRKPHSGYKIVFIPFAHGAPDGVPVDVLTGFLSPSGKAWGRPVGVAVDYRGALFVADDVGNTVWHVTPR